MNAGQRSTPSAGELVDIGNYDPFIYPDRLNDLVPSEDSLLFRLIKEVYRKYRILKAEKPAWILKVAERDEEIFYLKQKLERWEEFGRRVSAQQSNRSSVGPDLQALEEKKVETLGELE